MKKLSEITLKISDEEYYNDGTIHHSILSAFARGGFDSIPTLFEKKESPSLLLGSLVDTLITGSEEEFNEKYVVADFPEISEVIANAVKGLFGVYKDTCPTLTAVPDDAIIAALDQLDYGKTWKPATRIGKVREPGTEYYRLLWLCQGKTLVASSMYQDALNMVNALRTAPNTSFLYQNTDDGVERVYQAKFRATIDGITYTVMADELLVFHDKKLVMGTDLKTTGKPEYKFPQSFIDWGYSQQSRLYYRVIKKCLEEDEYFKDFHLSDWYFITVNKEKLCPLVWVDTDTTTTGTLYYGPNKEIEVKDPFDVAKELQYYLDNSPAVPLGISLDQPNNIANYLNQK